MPLVLITGLPSSGKTHRAQQIFADFQTRLSPSSTIVQSSVTVQHLTSSHASRDPPQPSSERTSPTDPLTNPRDLIYNSAREEKTARAEEFSAAKRALSKNNIVILDAPNYIKGFRYQLWCEAKAVGTRSVVIHTAAREEECKLWNEERIKAWGWDEILKETDISESEPKNAKLGKDVRGDLQPESHTAIYGDRFVSDSPTVGTKSRSSSMGGGSEGGLEGRREVADTMTLKSLYISNRKDDLDQEVGGTNGNTSRTAALDAQNGSSPSIVTTAPSSPPSSKASLPYSPATLQSLSMRYEPPSPFTRWDTPLFTVPSTDIHPPYQAIWDALFPPPVKPTKKAISQLRSGESVETIPEEVRRHAATVLPKATGAEALQILESATADVVKILLATARDRRLTDGEGGSLSFLVPNPKTGNDIQVEVDIPLNTMLSQPALQRMRRKYTQIQRGGIAHGQGYMHERTEIVKDFSRFLETEWKTE